MNRTTLNQAIFSVYAGSTEDLDQRNHNQHVDRILSTLKSAENTTLASPVMKNLEADKATSLKDNFSAAIELIDSERYPNIDSRDDYLDALVAQYIKSVSDFTASGGKGFYDCALNIYVKYEHGLQPVIDLIDSLQQNGCDIQVVEQLSIGNPDNDQYRSAGAFSCIYPCSEQNTLVAALDALKNDVSFYMMHYFIAPVLHEIPDNALAFAQEMTADMRKNDNYPEKELCLDAITAMGLSRTEFSSWYDDNLQRAVKKAIQFPDMYRNDGDHINGMMPTRMCYEDSERERFGLTLAEKSNGLQRRNLRDEVIIYRQAKPCLEQAHK